MWAQITRVPSRILVPIITIVALFGVYGLNNSMFDVVCMIIFGILAYFLKKADFPLAPLLLTFILGGEIEFSLVQSMTMFRGDFTQFFARPICIVLMVIIVATLIVGSLTAKKRIEKFGGEEAEV